MFRRLSAIAAVALACLSAPAPAGPPAAATLEARVSASAAAFESASGAVAGVSAVDLKTGRAVLSLRADELFLPASNQKLLTFAFALVRLGGGFRFATGVFLVGEDLVVAGEGDPTLGDPHLAALAGTTIYAELDRWARAVRDKAGPAVRHVLVCPEPGGTGRHPSWPARQRRKWYAAPVSTLNFHNNCFDVTFAKVPGGLVPVVQPQSRYIRIQSRLKAGSSNLWSLRPEDGDALLVLSGTVARATDDPISVAVDRPALLLGRCLADRIARAGVRVTGRVRRVAPRQVPWSAAKPICLTTTPLFVVLRRAGKRSLNMTAEAVFLRAGDGTWAGSAEMMARTLSKTYGLAPGSVVPSDGSGLSRANRVSPAAITKVLSAVARRPDGVLLLASLPVGGVDGTLASRFRAPPCRGRIVAKTGYIHGVSCLSGYVLDERRRTRLAFSVLVNRIRGGTAGAKALQETVCRLLVDSIEPPAKPAAP